MNNYLLVWGARARTDSGSTLFNLTLQSGSLVLLEKWSQNVPLFCIYLKQDDCLLWLWYGEVTQGHQQTMCLFRHRCVETLAATQPNPQLKAHATSRATYRRLFADLSWLATRALSAPLPLPRTGTGSRQRFCVVPVRHFLASAEGGGGERCVDAGRTGAGEIERSSDCRAGTAFSLVRLHLHFCIV